MKEELWLWNVKCLWIVAEISYAFAKKKYNCQTRNTEGIIDVKEHMAYKCRIYEAVNLTLHGHYRCVYSLKFSLV